MGTDTTRMTGRGRGPLTREDVERLLAEAGSSERLDLRSADLERADLSYLALNGADLYEATLKGADLSWTDLSGANLIVANLSRADLIGANLSRADLIGANLSRANLSGANLSGANLIQADLSGANLIQANLSAVIITTQQHTYLQGSGAFGLESAVIFSETSSGHSAASEPAMPGTSDPAEGATFSLRLLEEPLTAYTLSTILASFTELHTKCWLIQQSRFADLMDYTQTHLPRYAQAASLRVTRLSYNSPALIFFAGVGQAIGDAMKKTLEAVLQAPKETIDAVAQAPERKEAAHLENEAAAQALEQQDREAHLRDRERELELREREIELRMRQAEAEVKIAEARLKSFDLTIEHALHLVELLNPEADPQTKAMAARTLVPQLLAFGQVTGLEITLLEEPAATGSVPKTQE